MSKLQSPRFGIEHVVIAICDLGKVQDYEFYEWYESEHIQKIESDGSIYGHVRFTPLEGNGLHRSKFVVIYQLSSDDRDQLIDTTSKIESSWRSSRWGNRTTIMGPFEELEPHAERLEKWEHDISHAEVIRQITYPNPPTPNSPTKDQDGE